MIKEFQKSTVNIGKRHNVESITCSWTQVTKDELIDLLEISPLGVYCWLTSRGVIKWANQSQLCKLGYDVEEYIGHCITEVCYCCVYFCRVFMQWIFTSYISIACIYSVYYVCAKYIMYIQSLCTSVLYHQFYIRVIFIINYQRYFWE